LGNQQQGKQRRRAAPTLPFTGHRHPKHCPCLGVVPEAEFCRRPHIYMKILYWLRSDLRLHDHEVLAALPAHTEALLPVYCFDPATLGPAATWACRGWAPPPAVLARNAGRPAAPVRGFGIWHSLCSWQPYHGTAPAGPRAGPEHRVGQRRTPARRNLRRSRPSGGSGPRRARALL